MVRRLVASLALSALVAGAVLADGPAMVYCGNFTPIGFRSAAGGKDAQARADSAMDIINKYLGGKAPTVTQKVDGPNIKLMIQKDVVAVVTPSDAKAEKSKNVKVLATSWASKLNKALKESSAVK